MKSPSPELASSDLFSVAGKTALVTGGSRGIGKMLANGLIDNGARVYIAARTASEVERSAEEMAQRGYCKGIVADIGTVAGVSALADEIGRHEAALDIVIHNAGVSGVLPIEDNWEPLWDQMFALNVKAPFFLTRALLPLLRARATQEDPSRVLCMASGSGQFIGYPDMYGYEASKAALIHLVHSLASGLAADNITVNAMVPGVVLTDQLQTYIDQSGADLLASTPTGKWTGAEEIAGMMLYYCGRAGANTTGQVLAADGGQLVSPKMRS